MKQKAALLLLVLASTWAVAQEVPVITGSIYGGGKSANVEGNTSVTMKKGIVGSIYGGGREGSVLQGAAGTGADTVVVNGGYIGYEYQEGIIKRTYNDFGNSASYHGIYGGGFGTGTVVQRTSKVVVLPSVEKVYVNGSIYGGGECGQVNGGYLKRSDLTSTTYAASTYYVFRAADSTMQLATGGFSDAAVYYQKITPASYDVNATTVDVRKGTYGLEISGSVYGGGRGFFISTSAVAGDTGRTVVPTETVINGTVYGNTYVNVGDITGDTSDLRILGMPLFVDQQKMIDQRVYNNADTTLQKVLRSGLTYVMDSATHNYVAVNPGGVDHHTITALKRDGTMQRNFDLDGTTRVPGVLYYTRQSTIAVAGGGELGAVRGSHDTYNASMTGGNTSVRLHSGILGGTEGGLVTGMVFGGGKSAAVDGTTSVLIDGDVRVCRQVFGGGCEAPVKALRRASENDTTTASRVRLVRGWVGSLFGGTFMAEMSKNSITRTVVGRTGANNDSVLVTDCVYGGSCFAPHHGLGSATMTSGKVGFARAGYDLTVRGDQVMNNYFADGDPSVAKNTVVGVPYDGYKNVSGSVYGGGYGPLASITRTYVVVNGGVVQQGVFGGGEMGAVEKSGSAITYTYKHLTPSGGNITETMTFCPGADTRVEFNGGSAGMVYGGGCGSAHNMPYAFSTTPGSVFGNTTVILRGGTVDTSYRSEDGGGGGVYGGGMEGIVYGDPDSTFKGSTVRMAGGDVLRLFGGGRGFQSSFTDINHNGETVLNRVSDDAGRVYGNTRVFVNNAAARVRMGLYGGGEGCYFVTNRGYISQRDTVGTVTGNVLVDITNGTINQSFGGGRIASVYGYSDFRIHGTATVTAAYGGNDISGKVFGRGISLATAHGTTVTRDSSEVYVHIYETPHVGRVFGGGNGNYDARTYATSASDPMYNLQLTRPVQKSTYVEVNLDSTGTSAHGNVGAAFAGGNAANVDTARIYLAGVGRCDTVFGGGNAATVTTYNRIMVYADNNNGTNSNLKAGFNNCNYVFCGNNLAEMDILPDSYLISGRLNYVYGGGNAGSMTALESKTAKDGSTVNSLSTYILANSNKLTVVGAIYGGCNIASVAGGTFVDVRTCESIANVFGGNDMGDTVHGLSRVDICGSGSGSIGNVYGGGNGNYEYTSPSPSPAPQQGEPQPSMAPAIVEGTPPYSDTTVVNLYGGTVGYLYGGGLAGDCGGTYLNIEDKHDGVLDASVTYATFGGGCGKTAYIGSSASDHPHRGNVARIAVTEYKSLHGIPSKAYGGGNAGDVRNTRFTLISTFETDDASPAVFDTIYGGCRAANILGTANTYMNYGDTMRITSTVIYGGNDYAGTVANTNLVITGGQYRNVYGAGNGDYEYSRGTYVAGLLAASQACDTVPVSEEVTLTLYGGSFIDNVYGGGNMGYVYKHDFTHPGNTTPHPTFASPDNYGRITVHVHGGFYRNNIYCGARGVENIVNGRMAGRQLVYGFKQLNMDNGRVKNAIHGGSEAVDDGYPDECDSIPTGYLTRANYSTYTTLRPSSVVNVLGGEVDGNVYGGGYRGNIYGSVYVNIGIDAVRDCQAWTTNYYGANDPYMSYRPNITDPTADGYVAAGDIYIEGSVYAGADWGDAGGRYTFDKRGVCGGETRILVDGKGYNTSALSMGSSLPFMNINSNLICSGTSVEGGDLVRHITVRHYGHYSCDPMSEKTLHSIQRADSVLLDSVAITFLGERDAYTAYNSPDYSFCRCDTILMRNRNIIAIKAPATYMRSMQFLKADGQLVDDLADLSALYNGAITPSGVVPGVTNYQGGDSLYACDNDSLCKSVPVCDAFDIPTDFTKFYIVDGVYVNVIDENDVFGEVKGFAYLMADSNSQAFFNARQKTASDNLHDGGFYATCHCLNTFGAGANPEYPYVNSGLGYRTWTIGNGELIRKRQISIVANSNVRLMPDRNMKLGTMTVGSGGSSVTTDNLALAKATLELPPTDAGHYYRIKNVIVDQDNGGQVVLLGAAYDTVGTDGWRYLQGSSDVDGRAILDNPNYTFGLYMRLNRNFQTVACPTDTHYIHTHTGTQYYPCQEASIVAGNEYLQQLHGFVSHPVVNYLNVIPTMDFYLTYDTSFSVTIVREVVFTMEEYDSVGNFVAPIEVTLIISTVIKDFHDEEKEILVMYNEGTSNYSVRKVILPASMIERTLYLDSIHWTPSVGSENYSNFFKLTTVSNTTAISAADPTNRAVAVTVAPTEDLSGSVTTGMGWRYTEPDARDIDVFALGNGSAYGTTASNNGAMGYALPGNEGKGLKVGLLDGRAAAAFDVGVHFDGSLMYPKDTIIGKILLSFIYVDGEGSGRYNLTIKVKTRQKGDTIYLASNRSVTRGGQTLSPHTGPLNIDAGKTPQGYLTTLGDALDHRVYQEGDVLCILDTMIIGADSISEQNVVMRGQDYSAIQVIRYSGSHYQFPSKLCAYRGPMFSIRNHGQLSTYYMRFNGSGCTRVKRHSQTGGNGPVTVGGNPYYENAVRDGDTLFASAPIFLLEGRGRLTLNNNSMLYNNINMWNGTSGTPGGAVGIKGNGVDKPTLTITNNVEIYNNAVLRTAATSGKPSGAGVHVDKGSLVLGVSAPSSAINITKNYYITSQCGTSAGTTYLLQTNSTDATGYRYALDTAYLNTQVRNEVHLLSNVFLPRTAPAVPDPDVRVLTDNISTVLSYSTEIPENTRIGINKWFPGGYDHVGEAPRDTISFAYVSVANQLYTARALQHHNFSSDTTEYNVFFHPTIGPYTLFLQRCATFHKMSNIASVEPAVAEYRMNGNASCPVGLDSIIYRVTGGFYPYTYTWEHLYYGDDNKLDSTLRIRTYTTPHSNDHVVAGLQNGDPTLANESNADTCLLVDMVMRPTAADSTFYYRVTATDLMGCQQTKYIDVQVKKTTGTTVDESSFLNTADVVNINAVAVPSATPSTSNVTDKHWSWSDTITGTDTRGSDYHARVYRAFHAVTLTKEVLMENSWGDVAMTAYDGSAITSGVSPVCEGSRIELQATPAARKSFQMWGFDPAAGPHTYILMPSEDYTVQAYFTPLKHWRDSVTTPPTDGSYVTQYNGDVDIYGEQGLAWLISRINGYNGVQPLPFRFKTVRVHPRTVGGGEANIYNMGACLWTPLGNAVEKFHGRFIVDPNVKISDIIINEKNMSYLGFFGYLDSAYLNGIELQRVMVRGPHHVGGLAAMAHATDVDACGIVDNTTAGIVTILSGNHTVGGLVAEADNSTINYSQSKVKLLGSAVYAGGVLGRGSEVTVSNTRAMDTSNMDAIYIGGIVGYSTGTPSGPVGVIGAKASTGSRLVNNYVNMVTTNGSANAGGVVGYADNTDIRNNYVYGSMNGTEAVGAVAGILLDNVSATNNYYLQGTASDAVGYDDAGAFRNYSSFHGSGNQCLMTTPVAGVNNLTRALNDWVRSQHDTTLLFWRSDLTGTENHGDPVFGTLVIIPFYDTIVATTCDYYEWQNQTLTESGSYSVHQTDSAIYVDSVMTLVLTVNSSTSSEFTDSVRLGESYSGYGFYLTEQETERVRNLVDSIGVATIRLVDSLLTVHGCDSVVTLSLIVYKSAEGNIITPATFEVKIYPNPTRGVVNVEASGLMEVEVYDASSRRIADRKVYDTDKVQLNLTNCSTGAYYLRVKTEQGTVVKKVIKK